MKRTHYAWLLVVLLWFVGMLNYLDGNKAQSPRRRATDGDQLANACRPLRGLGDSMDAFLGSG